MFKRNCVVKYVDSLGVDHAAKVEAESLFEAAVRGLHRLDSSFWAEEEVWDRMCIAVEVYEEAVPLPRGCAVDPQSGDRHAFRTCRRSLLHRQEMMQRIDSSGHYFVIA
jgi:hypothetical protein